MSCDKLVYDLSQEVEGSPNVFIRKDWLNILDNQNQNYQNNQCIIDTSQLTNSNKYLSYREAYLAVPMLLSLVVPQNTPNIVTLANQCDYSIGLKNWFGQILHSMTLDYNGTTIVQQTPFCNMWNTFKLLTSLSWSDVASMGPTIGFYPDNSTSWCSYNTSIAQNDNGVGVCNNDLGLTPGQLSSIEYSVGSAYIEPVVNVPFGGNYGASFRTSCINYRPSNEAGTDLNAASYPYSYYLTGANSSLVWKSYISTAVNNVANGAGGVFQISVMATIYLRHIHSFFNMCPLLKGVFMKLTLNLNNTTTNIQLDNTSINANIMSYNSNVFIGGCNPLLIPSGRTGSSYAFVNAEVDPQPPLAAGRIQYYNLSVGSICTDNTVSNAYGGNLPIGQISKSVYLYVPAYTFNPTFEKAYLSNNIKQIKYTDIYQYQVLNIGANSQFNNLITNGIANIKSVLIIPFLSQLTNAGASANYNEWQSPFDCAGCGTTAPLTVLGNFNVQISGQNAIYNMQKYSFEEWNNQLYGQNAVNGGLTDGLNSGLINFNDFNSSYCYYYVNVERMLPVEQSVPKSVQIIGTNYNAQTINLWVFIEYGVQVSVDVLTGARV